MPTGLIRRNGRYSLRRVVPKDLQPYLGREIVRALGTSSPSEAKRLHAKAWLALDQKFDSERLRVCGVAEPNAVDTPAGDEPTPLEDISPTRISVAEVDRLRRGRAKAAEDGTLREFTTWARDTLRLVQAMLEGEMTPSHPLEVLEGRRNALVSVLTGEGAHYIAAARKAREEIDREKEAATGPNLSQVVTKWATEVKPTIRTRKRITVIAEEFSNVAGTKSVARYTKTDVIGYKDHLLASKTSIANINSKLGFLSIPFGYALRNDLIGSSPVKGVSVPDNRKAREKRRAFSINELKTLFAGPVHQSATRPVAGGGEAAYWLPLLALYTGARLTELGQLFIDDVMQETYLTPDGEKSAWVIRIVEDVSRGQQVKNQGSERRVPIHRDLQDLGFLDFAHQKRQAGSDTLFPFVKPAHGDRMAAWSKWFGRYRRSLGVSGKDTPFHSFRHTFKKYARDSGIAAQENNALTGHETGDVADAYGDILYPLSPLVNAIASYRIPGLELPPPPTKG